MSPSDSELAEEQSYVDVLYARLDELVGQTGEQLSRVQRQKYSTHQNRSERDAFVALYEDRLATLRSVEDKIVFGRLDQDSGQRHYIGRIGLFTSDREQLLVDWRAPAAAPFYQATAAHNLGVALRRHLVTRRRAVVSIEDDVLDADLLDQEGTLDLQGEGALLASLTQQRTGRMGDIVATIQTEQDQVIRSATPGTLVVQGGPGTGKTAVALHRAAYMLYTHRRKLSRSGVLIVAPTSGFLRYIEKVLPSLGETGVVMLTPGELVPGVRATVHDGPAAAALKGDQRMAKVIARAVKNLQRVPDGARRLRVVDHVLELRPADVRAARSEARTSRRPHNQARAVFVRAMLDRLVTQYEEAITATGGSVFPEERGAYLQDLRGARDVRVALNLCWMPTTPQGLLETLFRKPHRLEQASRQLLTDAERRLLAREAGTGWTVEDVPLLDEAAELLGEDDALERSEHKRAEAAHRENLDYAQKVLENVDTSGIVRAEDLAGRMSEQSALAPLAERAAADRSWAYGHVVVDEAQEHSDMMWRALVRRCPSRSFTLVGDISQTSSAAGSASWEEALEVLGSRFHLAELTVSYRTPRQLMDRALSVARAHGLRPTPLASVRDGERPPRLLPAPDDLDGAVSRLAEEMAAATEGGTVVVLSAASRVPSLATALAARLGRPVGTGSSGVDDPVAVMTPTEAKGLEFDSVVLVEPAEVLRAHPRGANDLYVAMTRATRFLDVVHDEPLPAGFEQQAEDSAAA